MEKFKRKLLAAIEKIGEMLCVALVFAAIAAIAFGLGWFVHLLEHHGADPFAIGMLKFAEYVMLAMDIAGILIYIFDELIGKTDE